MVRLHTPRQTGARYATIAIRRNSSVGQGRAHRIRKDDGHTRQTGYATKGSRKVYSLAQRRAPTVEQARQIYEPEPEGPDRDEAANVGSEPHIRVPPPTTVPCKREVREVCVGPLPTRGNYTAIRTPTSRVLDDWGEPLLLVFWQDKRAHASPASCVKSSSSYPSGSANRTEVPDSSTVGSCPIHRT